MSRHMSENFPTFSNHMANKGQDTVESAVFVFTSSRKIVSNSLIKSKAWNVYKQQATPKANREYSFFLRLCFEIRSDASNLHFITAMYFEACIQSHYTSQSYIHFGNPNFLISIYMSFKILLIKLSVDRCFNET